MKTIAVGIILGVMLVFSNIPLSDSTLGKLVVTVKPEKTPIRTDEFPVIMGTITDEASRPIADATVKISLAAGTVVTSTDSSGSFRYEYIKIVTPGHYLINVIATKDGYGMGLGTTNYYVNGPITPTISGINSVNQPTNNVITSDNIKKSPLELKILQHIEKKNKEIETQEQKLKEIEQRRQFIEEQRRIAADSLQKDLERWDAQLGPFSPRNAFAMFVSQINGTVQNIFWGQYNFTEQKSNDGYAAKMLVLKNGGTIGEARKAFHEKALTSRNELLKVNNDLNVKYGFADKKTQDQFNMAGKLPRHGR